MVTYIKHIAISINKGIPNDITINVLNGNETSIDPKVLDFLLSICDYNSKENEASKTTLDVIITKSIQKVGEV
jgi:hypothetical protein